MTNTVRKTLTRVAWAFALFATTLTITSRAFAAPPSPLDPGSENAAAISGLFYTVLWIAIGVFVVVEGLLIFAIIRYRRRPSDDPDFMPQQIHGNVALEFMWTIIPAGILVSLFIAVIPLLKDLREAPQDAMVVEVIGHQWFWEFRYPDTGVAVNNTMVLPITRPVLLEIRSEDVIHSFWVPQLAGKKDAIPGHTNTLWFEISTEGTYKGQCAELCGVEHYAMLLQIEAMNESAFNAWMQDQIARFGEPMGTDLDSPLPDGNPANGEVLFIELGCTACHSIDGSTLVGPSMLGIGERATSRIQGYSPEQYVRESILLPCQFVVESFQCVMPQTFGERIDAQALADIISYLLEQ